MLEPGSLLKRRYLIESHIGKGGMGSVYLATDETFGSRVALKETIVEGAGLEEAFEREARVLNRLRHGAIPVVMDYFMEGDGRFLVMQYIPGDDLSTLLRRNHKPFAPDRVLEWADQLLDALTYLHTQDPPIIHRDIKPQNLKLTDRGDIVLLDFGLSKAAVGDGAERNVSLVGYTLNYAPIEQIQGDGTDARSDLFSLAATLYHLLTGLRPPDVVRRLTGRKQDPLRPIHDLVPAVSPKVSAALMSALAIHREDRPPSAAEFRATLKGAALEELLSRAQAIEAGGNGSPSGSTTAALASATAQAARPATVHVDASPSELPTLLTAAASHAAPAPPSPAPALVRNVALPSTVSFVFETLLLEPDGRLARRERRVARQFFEDAGCGVTIAMAEVPKGSFSFGSPEVESEREASEGPTLDVGLDMFFISRTPITQAQWRAVATSLPMASIDLDRDPSHFKGDERPVEMVSWEGAVEFCQRLAAHTGRAYRLPSEAQWEYACRAGSAAPFCFGPTITVEVANVDGTIGYGGSPGGNGRGETTPVGSLGAANRFGLFDMHGNVWEWTEDQWHDSLGGAPVNGAPWIEGGDSTVRVVRGGGWASIPADARSAKRFGFPQKGRRNDVGFRVAMLPFV